MTQYALIENSVVIQVDCNPREGFIECPDYVVCSMIKQGDTYVNPPPPVPTPEEKTQQNKQRAVILLQQTDWTTIPDVANPSVSSPYLNNASEFASFRSSIRAIAVNPTPDAVFPETPKAKWTQ